MATGNRKQDDISQSTGIVLTDEDVYEAMRMIPGYLDISLADFRDIYLQAFQHAKARIRKTLKVESVMTGEVVSAESALPVQEVAALMAEKEISGLPVLNPDKTVAGIISREDFFARLGEGKHHSCMALLADCLVNKGCAALAIRGKTAGDIMSSPPVTVHPEDLLSKVASLMAERKINRLPVVDQNDRLAGFLTRTDLINSFPYGD